MADDFPARSSDRGRDRHFSNTRDDEYQQRDRSDSSRSPSRQAVYDDSRDKEDGYGGGYQGQSRDYSDVHGYSAYQGHDYSNMYDDGQEQWQHGEYEGRRRGDRDRDRGRYRDRDAPDYEHSHHDNDWRGPQGAGAPNDTIILEGISADISASELQDIIQNNTIAAECAPIDVRLAGSSGNRRAFIQFPHLDYAIAFIGDYYPKLRIDLPPTTDGQPGLSLESYVHYARKRDDDNAWPCPRCNFSNYASRTICKNCGTPQPSASEWKQNYTGATDTSNEPSQILVVYPVNDLVSEDTLASELKRLELEEPLVPKEVTAGAPKLKSTAPTGDTRGLGARPGSLHRVFLMRETQTHESMKFGFVEFWTQEDAHAAIIKVQKGLSFSVCGRPVSVCYIHAGVFMADSRDPTPTNQHQSFSPLFNPSLRVRYRDPRLYPGQLLVAPNPPAGVEVLKKNDEENADKKAKKRKAEGALGASVKKKAPVGMAGQMALWQRKKEELNTSGGTANDRPAMSDANAVPIRAPANAPIKFNFSAPKAGVSDSGASAPAPPSTEPPPPSPVLDGQEHQAGDLSTSAAADSDKPQLSYADRDKLQCLLCMRKFKGLTELDLHEKSTKHKEAIGDDKLVKTALVRLTNRGIKPIPIEFQEQDSQADQYRDRAKERRQANAQPKKLAQQLSKTKPENRPAQQDPAPAKPGPSRGAGMLAKMGWTAGAGLGAKGEGRTEVIETNVYQQGVGLGAEGGNLGDAAKEAERNTKGTYTEYVSSVQDKARARFNKM